MRIVVQRVLKSKCEVDNQITGEIEKGYMILVGFGQDDNEDIAIKMANKLIKLRIFDDENGKINLSLADVKGKILSISQFTLYADCTKGNRPSFVNAMQPSDATKLYHFFNEYLRSLNIQVEEGIFGADMKISLINDGPVTIILDSKELL
ncbi:MAG: D-aminoacyl-tRNA deacylase [Erysipelotrichaceae bacterium]|nr:D-aminoacyl-tRNA deacylase [Erysipelotrichaceae bacterium]